MNDTGRLIATEIPRLRRYAWALTGDRSAADDLVQDCLERAWSRLHLWRRGSNLRAWLFTILHNIYANDARRRMRRPVVVSLTDAVVTPAVPPTQDMGIEVANLDAALKRLPEDQRAAVLLVGLEELSYREAAAALGIPAGTGAGEETLQRVK